MGGCILAFGGWYYYERQKMICRYNFSSLHYWSSLASWDGICHGRINQKIIAGAHLCFFITIMNDQGENGEREGEGKKGENVYFTKDRERLFLALVDIKFCFALQFFA